MAFSPVIRFCSCSSLGGMVFEPKVSQKDPLVTLPHSCLFACVAEKW